MSENLNHTARALQIQDELLDGLLTKAGEFVTAAQISRRGTLSVSKLSQAATGDKNAIMRVTQKRTCTIRTYAMIQSYIQTYDPRGVLPGIDEPAPEPAAEAAE